MDAQRHKAFLVDSIVSAQATIDAIRADLGNPDYLEHMSYDDQCMAGDEIAFQQATIANYMDKLASYEPTPV